ncbi:MAG: hypothetical protein COW42_02450 [Deltaproteobacteria bacterium CG17_big_fil_post_rev_8_21_14_2_50_63_7]|nr:MAG: hypothetical protein COW42_02450 [Deltaproteobacteria bacterium CG17_big_fil_post_rev_8_21_14_2_50_63_7]
MNVGAAVEGAVEPAPLTNVTTPTKPNNSAAAIGSVKRSPGEKRWASPATKNGDVRKSTAVRLAGSTLCAE